MYNGMTSAQESGLSMTLAGLKLEKYLQLFNKKCIKFETFINLTKEDLDIIGITDEADQEAILDGIEPLKHLHKEVNDLGPPNLDAVLGNTIHHLKTLVGMMIIIRRKLQKKRPKNTLVDINHSAGGAVIHLLDVLGAQLDYINSDFSGPEVVCKKESFNSRKLWCLLGAFTAVASITSILTIRYLGTNSILSRCNIFQFS